MSSVLISDRFMVHVYCIPLRASSKK